MTAALEDVIQERQKQLKNGMDDFDKVNTKSDWISYVNAYTNRAASKVFIDKKDNQNFRKNMIKVAALALAAAEAYDKGWL